MPTTHRPSGELKNARAVTECPHDSRHELLHEVRYLGGRGLVDVVTCLDCPWGGWSR